eukprot:scaffold110144_cov60-Phaeocystis_antarctica.AAC.1
MQPRAAADCAPERFARLLARRHRCRHGRGLAKRHQPARHQPGVVEQVEVLGQKEAQAFARGLQPLRLRVVRQPLRLGLAEDQLGEEQLERRHALQLAMMDCRRQLLETCRVLRAEPRAAAHRQPEGCARLVGVGARAGRLGLGV